MRKGSTTGRVQLGLRQYRRLACWITLPLPLLLLLLLLLLTMSEGQSSQPTVGPPSMSVGMPQQINQIVLPGARLQAKPLVRQQPVVVRIVASFPHGSAYRYDLEYCVLEPGRFDLRDFLQREDGSAMVGVPEIVVAATSLLPAGQVQPNEVRPGWLPAWGGYRTLLVVAGVLWLLGLMFLLAPRRKRHTESVATERAATLEERLRRALQAATTGDLTASERAELERMVLAYWRRRLGLEQLPAAEAMNILRQDPRAGTALRKLEQWLHHPTRHSIEDFVSLIEPVDASSQPQQA